MRINVKQSKRSDLYEFYQKIMIKTKNWQGDKNWVSFYFLTHLKSGRKKFPNSL